MRQFTKIAWVIVALPVFGISAHAKLDIKKDCSDASQIFAIPPTETSAFLKWCENFESSCYKLESESAKTCGGNGAQEAQGRQSVEDGSAQMGTGNSYKKGTAAGQEMLSSAIIVRKFQLQICTRNLDKCNTMTSKFTSQTGPKTLSCTNFTPESDAWAPAAKASANMCQATAAEIARVQSELQIAETQNKGMADISDAADGSAPGTIKGEKLNAPDARACGLFGCAQNPDGTYSPKMAPGAESSTPTDDGQSYRRLPTSNQEIRLPTEDARACGIFGCERNEDGTYSPKYVRP